MTLSFNFATHPSRILFGRGRIREAAEAIASLGGTRALVLSTDQQKDAAQALATSLGRICLGVYAKATMHTPIEVTEAAMEVISEQRVDCVLSFGGGSTIGLGKAIAWRTDLPQLVIPTTYAGSEVTPILGQTEKGKKSTLTDPKVLPEAVIYDPEVTLTLPAELSITSGINAIAHAVEALYARDRHPMATMMASEGARALIEALPSVADDPLDLDAREQALYGSWLCGAVLGSVGMALHHKLCHALGGTFDLPHAETHTIVLPHATAYNFAAVPEQLAPVADALGHKNPGAGLHAFAKRLGAPTALKDLGMAEQDIPRAANIAMANPYWNPRALEHARIEDLIRAAWEGAAPNT